MQSKNLFNSINRVVRKLNPLIIAILRSPLHSMMSKSVLVITFTGRKSGKQYTTPIMYAQDGETVYVFTHGGWWKNLQGGAPVSLRLRGEDRNGFALAVSDDKQKIADGLGLFISRHPINKGVYEVTLDENGKPKAEDLLRAAQTVIMIQVQIEEIEYAPCASPAIDIARK